MEVVDKEPQALLCSLAGRRPALSGLEVVMHCDKGLTHPDDVDSNFRAAECADRLYFGHHSPGQIFNFS